MGKTKAEQAETRDIAYLVLWNAEKRSELLIWWKSLEDSKGSRAQLRRCASPEAAALHPETYRVRPIVPWASYEAAATIAGILPHVKAGENDATPIGSKLAKPLVPGGSAPFSETRFRQLLKSRDWDEFYRNLRRAVQLLRGVVNPVRVADLILAWDRESRPEHPARPGESLKFKLSEQYYTSLKS